MKYENISEWIVEDNVAYRYILGTDKHNPNNRLAMIEKTPRIQIIERFCWLEKKNLEQGIAISDKSIHSFWISGFTGPDCYGIASRKWCDQMLKTMYGFNW